MAFSREFAVGQSEDLRLSVAGVYRPKLVTSLVQSNSQDEVAIAAWGDTSLSA